MIFSSLICLWAEPMMPVNISYDKNEYQGFYSQNPRETLALASNEKDAQDYTEIVNRKYAFTSLDNEIRNGIRIFGYTQTDKGWIFKARDTRVVLQIYLASAAKTWTEIKNLDKQLKVFFENLPGIKRKLEEKVKNLDEKISNLHTQREDKNSLKNSITKDLTDFDLMYLFYKNRCDYDNSKNDTYKPFLTEIQEHISSLLTEMQKQKNEQTRQNKKADYFVLNDIIGNDHNNILKQDLKESGLDLYIHLAYALCENYNQTAFLNEKINGSWGGNNCIFNSILWHPEVIEEIVEFFGKEEKLDPKDPRFMTDRTLTDKNIDDANTDGGKTLRRIVCEWIVKNKDKKLAKELEVKETLIGIDTNKKLDAILDDIDKLAKSTAFINEEVLTAVSVKIDRPIIVTTKHPEIANVLVPKIGGTLGSLKLNKKPIYIINKGNAISAASSSGIHYNGLKEVDA